jgi:hypothetical protein
LIGLNAGAGIGIIFGLIAGYIYYGFIGAILCAIVFFIVFSFIGAWTSLKLIKIKNFIVRWW